jgi:hypothetical protein
MLGHLAHALGGGIGHVEGLPILAMERHIVAPFAATPRGLLRRAATV